MTISTDRINIEAGTLLFAEGEVGTIAYVIKRGRIEIFLQRDGEEVQLVVRGPGEIVGEMAIIDRGLRSASARVLEDCELSLITEEQFARRIEKTDPILRMCLGVVLDRYRQTVAMLNPATLTSGRVDAVPVTNRHFAEAMVMLSLESELRRAIAEGELELYYQPIVHVPDCRLAGFEALIRWNHPERGLLLPASFIPVAEASGQIVDITAWCIGEVGRTFPRMIAAALGNAEAVEPLFMSINVSGHDLTQATFISELATMLDQTGLAPGSIKLEITESVLMDEPQRASAVLRECRDRGLMIAIDDFGTGYSSLSHLGTLPITTIKIDQSFVRSMLHEPTSRKIVQMILNLAAELQIPAVAEGIETESQARDLDRLGCALGQGYLFGRPKPLATTLQLIRDWPVATTRDPAEESRAPLPAFTTAA